MPSISYSIESNDTTTLVPISENSTDIEIGDDSVNFSSAEGTDISEADLEMNPYWVQRFSITLKRIQKTYHKGENKKRYKGKSKGKHKNISSSPVVQNR